MQLPAHAYVPGRNERHPEDTFDEIRQTAVPGESAHSLARCDAFVAGLHYLEAGFYWEAHEVWEPVWMALPDGSIERQFVQTLIQLANGRLKWRMGRAKAALRLVGIARALVPGEARQSKIMTLETAVVHQWIDALEHDVIASIAGN